jgi:ubiquitin-conjugating enzyme E2 J1
MMAPSTMLRRLLRETLELSASSPNPTPSFHAQPVSDEDLFEWHFTLLGPPSPSPYAGGLYHGRISLPRTYPLKPPNFRFLTPSGRFEVNREICLSISGFHEESWMPAWGIRTALVALRTFMGEEGTAGQVGGLESSYEVRAQMAKSSRQWRCEGCGGRSNEDIMEEWWKVCRQKGLKVEEEAGLEHLPEGLKLGFKEPTTTADGEKRPSRSARPERPAVEGTNTNMPSESTAGTKAAASDQVPVTLTLTHRKPSHQHIPSIRPEQRSNTVESTITTASASRSSGAAPPPPRAAATQAVTANTTTPTLDKTISALAVLLAFMVLKKVLSYSVS